MPAAAAAPEPIDPFDPAALRMDSEDVTTEKPLLTVPVRKPNRTEFFRVHPSEDYSLDTLVYERDGGRDNEVYLIAPSLRDELVDVGRLVRLYTCISLRKVVFLWPAKLPLPEGGGRSWQQSALEIADEAQKSWVRMWGNKDLAAYEMRRAKGDHLEEPVWPQEPLKELLKIAFKHDRLIDSPHHEAIRELNGEL